MARLLGIAIGTALDAQLSGQIRQYQRPFRPEAPKPGKMRTAAVTACLTWENWPVEEWRGVTPAAKHPGCRSEVFGDLAPGDRTPSYSRSVSKEVTSMIGKAADLGAAYWNRADDPRITRGQCQPND